MNHKHSFLTRCLAMLMALVLVLSNANIGLTMRLQAAETGNLFELIAGSTTVGNKDLNAVLNYADALQNVNNEKVSYEEAPQAADATLITGVLTVNPVNGWVPYTVNGEKVQLVDNKVEMNVSGESARVVYKLDLNLDEIIADKLDTVSLLAAEAQGQYAALLDVLAMNEDGSSDTMTALNVMTTSFLDDMAYAVECLTLAALGADADLNKDGKIDAADSAELVNIQNQYLYIIGELQKLIVTPGSKYDTEVNGRYPNRNKMAVRVLLSGYMDQGLAYFYKNADDMIAEFQKLSTQLNNMLTVTDSHAVMNTLIEEMGYGSRVQASHLGGIAERMANCVATLKQLSMYKTEIDLTSSALVGLCDALLAVEDFTYESSDLCMYSKSLSVRDDSWRWIKVVLGDTDKYVDVRMVRNSVVTEADVLAIIAQVQAEVPNYAVVTDSIEALLGKTMTEDLEITVALDAKTYPVVVVDAEGNKVAEYKVSEKSNVIVIEVANGHEVTYLIDGVEYVKRASFSVELNIDKVAAADPFTITLVKDFDYFKYNLMGEDNENSMVNKVAEALGREDALTFDVNEETGEIEQMNLSLDFSEMQSFVEVLTTMVSTNGDVQEVTLNGEPLVAIGETSKAPELSMGVMLNAMLGNPSFMSSDNMIAMGEGSEDANTNMLADGSTMGIGYEIPMNWEIENVPAEMQTVAKGLSALSFMMTFRAEPAVKVMSRMAQTEDVNKLVFSIDLPEKVYEAYLTALLASGYMDNDQVDELEYNVEIAMAFVTDYFNLLASNKIDVDVLTNTLKRMGIDKDISAAEEYLNMVNSVLGKFYADADQENAVEFTKENNRIFGSLYLTEEEVFQLMSMMYGMDPAAKEFLKQETIRIPVAVELVNEAPEFDALVVEPTKVLADSNMAKLNTVNYTTDLASELKGMSGPIAVMLMDDIDGDLVFPSHAIIDLNGQTVKGDIKVNGKVVIVDSCMITYGGGTVEGKVKATGGAILGGTYGSNVSKFLRDGYVQENGSVHNAMFATKNVNGAITYVLNPDFYEQCEGYLPSVTAVAAEIAADVALNFYPAAALVYHGDESNKVYGVEFETILDSYLGDGVDGAIDALIEDAIAFIGVDGINELTNDIIDDLTNFKAMAVALDNETALASYKFSVHPIAVAPVVENGAIDVSVVANYSRGKTFEVAVAIDKDANNKYLEAFKELVRDMAKVLTVDANVNLDPIVYEASKNDLFVSGSASTDVVLDLTGNINYTKALAIMLAYGNPDDRDALMAARDCVVELNAVIAEMTIEDVFSTLKALNRKTTIAEMADAVGYKYTKAEITELDCVYRVIMAGMGKVLEVLDVTGNNTKLSAYDKDGNAEYQYGRTASGDAHLGVFSYDGTLTITAASVSVTLKLAPKCNAIIGDADWDGEVTTFDSALILEYKAYLCDESELHMCVSDVDADGEVTSFDAAMILEYKSKLIDRFPAEEN